ncbi:MAG: CBS domain-containing protein, partial [Alphaproteobacteria bacterium]|nr:CBS domain-containing protein [Alphaproteobacteria bacterium]
RGRAPADGADAAGTRIDETLQQTANQMADQMSQTLRAWFALGGFAPENLAALRQDGATLAEEMMRAHQRLLEQMLGTTAHQATLAVPQRLATEWCEAMLSSGFALLRAARDAADETLRPWQAFAQGHWRGGVAEVPGRVAEVMDPATRMERPDDTVQHAAQRMRDEDAGALPVGDGDHLIGMLTDRDVALRLVAEGRDPARTPVREVMTSELRSVFEDAPLDDVARMMTEQRLRRLAVIDRQKHLVGVVTLAHLMDRRRAGPHQARAARAAAEPRMPAQ